MSGARSMHLASAPTIWLPETLLVPALAFVGLGLFPDQQQALYLKAVGLGLLMSAMGLFVVVFGTEGAQSGFRPGGAMRHGRLERLTR